LLNDPNGRKAVLSRIKSGALGVDEAVRLLSGPVSAAPVERVEGEDAGAAAALTAARLTRQISRTIASEARIPLEQVRPDDPFDRYGFDSVMALNVVRALEADFGTLPATLLFECRTVDDLVRRLIREHAPISAHAVAAARPRSESTDRPAPESTGNGIAVIGLSGRFPGADDLDAFWDNLATGRDCITEIPAERWDHLLHHDPRPGTPGRSYSKWGGFVSGVDTFDAEFFRISPREAERMDPQERLFLQETWHVLEDAGLTRSELAGQDIGVYVGVMYSQYQLIQAEEAVRGNPLHLGSSYASIANRVSHFFDFRGPSMALDTMCSSSLTAIHLACEALRRGEVGMAVAGGVNLTIHPNKHIDLSQGRFASTDGRCRSFGAGGDGYVPGEGIGAVLLKPLHRAVADGDRVHAVVRGSAIGHGGRTNGYTVPSPQEQTRLIVGACRDAGIRPGDISYVEAHGTGTPLGDPIEINALAKALGDPAERRRTVVIGSVKSNIGHLESAAGIAALAKVALQLRHRRLVPSLHAEVPNPHIDFDAAGLRLEREGSPWEPIDDNGAAMPRIAGISSFGAGGANAHLIIEEPPAPTANPTGNPKWADTRTGPQLIVLSACDREALRTQALALADYAHRHGSREGTTRQERDGWLAGAAHTLRSGREALDERLATVVADTDELVSRLRRFGESGTTDQLLLGSVGVPRPDGPAGTAPARNPADGPDAAHDLWETGRLWAGGAAVEWSRPGSRTPQPVTLPGYTFARTRHWPELSDGATAVAAAAVGHPLLDHNISTFAAQRFRTTLRHGSPLIRDHTVRGRKLLPGAAIVEMVLGAARVSGFEGDLRIEDLVWSAPVDVPSDASRDVLVELTPDAAEPGRAAFTVRGTTGTVHARGAVCDLLGEQGETPETPEPPGRPVRDREVIAPGLGVLDTAALTAALSTPLDIEESYRSLASRGLRYGDSLRVLAQVRSGPGEALARVTAGAPERGVEHADWLLHPALLDGAFQTLIALERTTGPEPLRIPFALNRLTVAGAGRLKDACWVHARARHTADGTPGASQLYDLTLADDEGHVVVRAEGLAVRPVPDNAAHTVTLRPAWQPAPPGSTARNPTGPARRSCLVLEPDPASGLSGLVARALRRAGDTAEVIAVRPGGTFRRIDARTYEVSPADGKHYIRLLEELAAQEDAPGRPQPVDAVVHAWSRPAPDRDAAVSAESLEAGFHALMALTRALVLRSPSAAVRLVYAHHGDQPAHSAVSAYHRALAAEHPACAFSTLRVTEPTGAERWRQDDVDRLVTEIRSPVPAGEEVRYTADGERQVARLVEVTDNGSAGAPPAGAAAPRGQGIYLLTGGMGGLGRVLALHLARRWQARLVLAGRAEPDEDQKRFLDDISGAGGHAVYVRADCSTADGARHAAAEARARFGRLDGVVHLAGTLRDGLLRTKRRQDVDAVLRPKVWGAHHLDRATKDDALDFFALFSSASSVTGIAGQSDYAYANAFLNHFADWREQRRAQGARSGHTVSVAWPLWASGGMGVGPAAERRIEEHLGWIALPAEQGMEAFESALRAPRTRTAVFHGRRTAILRTLDQGPAPAPVAGGSDPKTGEGDQPTREVTDSLVAHLTLLVAAELKMPAERVGGKTPLDRFGLESVMVMNITRELEEIFGSLPKTLFFEYPSLSELARYLIRHHRDAVVARFGAPAPPAAREPAPTRIHEPVARAGQPGPRAPAARREENAEVPLAIVGLSGRYPMADDLDEFWDNLRQARDCVTEIPASRWDHSGYFEPHSRRPGSSYSKWGGFLSDIDRFDPLFFNIPPREARLMDPQERLFLETAWHTIEDAGHTRSSLRGRRVGVFVGVMYSQYQLYGAQPAMQEQGFVPGSLSASVANRVSYVLGLTGPSLALDTMCSSSLTALHLACSSIRLGDCEQALVGGVNAILHPNRYLQLSQTTFGSTDGRCRSFGEGGDGYVPGEGVGAVLVKPLSRAEADGDHIYAVIRGTALNHGGRSNGYTVPTPVAQADVIERALRAAGVAAEEIGYVEAHGTGTSLGDPIEIAGLSRAFENSATGPLTPCPTGSVKSNIGHLESAAGIAGITKVLLQFKHGEFAPSLHAERLNPNVRFEDGPFRVQRVHEPWPTRSAGGRALPRLGAVSSFGAGGSNAHVILEEYVGEPSAAAEAAPGTEPGTPELIVVSARTEERLRVLAGSLARALAPRPAIGVPSGASVASAAGSHVPDGLAAAAADLLGVTAGDIEPDDDLRSLGFDAVMFAELAERVRVLHGLEEGLPPLQEIHCLRDLGAWAAGHAVDGSPSGSFPAFRLRDIAHTLGAGREALAERLAFVATDLPDLTQKLAAFGEGDELTGLVRGRAPQKGGHEWHDLLDGVEGETFLRALRERGDLGRLARLWASGVDLAALDGTPAGARRISLPGYPFARDRYWLPEEPAAETAPAPAQAPEPAPEPDALPTPRPAAAPVSEPLVPDLPATATAVDPPDEERARSVVLAATAAVLELPEEEFGLDTPHSDFGVDSVFAVEIVERINAELDTELRPTDFFNYPTLRKLADFVAGQQGPRLPPRVEPVPPTPPTAAAPARIPGPRSARAEPRPQAPPVKPGDVAVIGMSGRFADAEDLDVFWANIAAGRDSVREIPAERWDVDAHWDADPQAPGKTYSKWGSLLAHIDRFDADFFGISPREARLMDPQQRLYLMEAYRALENAGYSDRSLDGTECHAFVGTSTGDYHQLLRAEGVPTEGYTFMGSHPAVLSSRLSYHLNLRGPSLAVDTSCSSSLMAVHLACEAIREGRCDMALAGGVAALVTPELHILASKAGMLSPRGRCRTFDDGADGFVPGEGVGAVVLKSLETALRDGDHVHGVIAASGANQDGRTSGLTAPSAPSQRALLTSVYRRFGVDPRHIGYVECHGTGTRLGDPIEIEALAGAFGEFTDRRGYCAVGSVKSNLGHTLTAAGVAGLFKTLLSLRHQQLAPTLHVETPNSYIPFDNSPFYVNTKLSDWPGTPGVQRHAAVSSFGFSGTNVHLVLREAPERAARRPAEGSRRQLCPVSAKTPQSLEDRLRELTHWLDHEGARHDWRDIVHTLTLGRSHHEVRAVFPADGAGDLSRQITRWHRSAPAVRDRVEGTGPDCDRARAYLAGGPVDWSTANGSGELGRRIPMPTYPFARDSYWIPGRADPAPNPRLPLPAEPAAPKRQPLAPGEERVFHHVLTPDQPLVRDHIVAHQPLLPAAGHLSLVHGALRELFGDTPFTINHAIWLRPFFVTGEREAEVAVRAGTRPGRYLFEVRGRESDGTLPVCSRGEVRIGAADAARESLDAIRTRCTGRTAAAEHYARFDRMGVEYGPFFRTVQEIRTGDREALVRLTRNDSGPQLPAGVFDGAVQSVAAIQPEAAGARPMVPFAMNSIRLLRPVPAESHVHVRQIKPGECGVTIHDPDGRPCVIVEGLSYRELREPVGLRYFSPQWSEAHRAGTSTAPEEVLIVTPSRDHGFTERLASHHRDADVRVMRYDTGTDVNAFADRAVTPRARQRIYFLGGLDDSFEGLSLTGFERSKELGVRSLFRLVKALFRQRGAEHPTELVTVTANGHALTGEETIQPCAAAIFGLTRSLAKENPNWQIGCVDVDISELSGENAAALAVAVAEEPAHPQGEEVVLRGGRRWTRFLAPAPAVPDTPDPPFRQGGTYLILGGTGGIGEQTALHLARRAGASIALLGRSPRTPAIEAQLRAVEDAGGHAQYVRTDATDEASMTLAVEAVRQRFGRIHGVFHSAIVLRDAGLETMEEEAFEAALAPKARGSVVLARVLRDEPPDFLAFYSSAQSFSGNAGQANYSAACTFKDAFATRVSRGGTRVRIINWGYWGEVGVVAKAGYRSRMRAMGVHSITPREGMRALETVLTGEAAQVMPLKAEERVLERMGVRQDKDGAAGTGAVHTGAAADAVDEAGRLSRAHGALDGLGARMAARAIQDMGAFTVAGERRSVHDLAEDLQVAPAHRQLLDTVVEMITTGGYLTRAGDELCATPAVQSLAGSNMTAAAERVGAEHPDVAAHTELLAECLREFPRLLRGEADPVSVMFPNSSMARVEGIYRDNLLSDRVNERAAQAVREAVEELLAERPDQGGPVRILEVGAGTGGTTNKVLKAVDAYADRLEYVYTDVSLSFLRHGKRRFGAKHPFVSFRELDIEDEPAGASTGTFDIVVAANVLHATRDLRRTTGHVGRLLGERGRLVLCETTGYSSFATLTFGLLDGWWKFEDPALRIPGSPLAAPETWEQLLTDAGLHEVTAHEPVPGAPRELGQRVIVADRRGAARTSRTAGSATVRRTVESQSPRPGLPQIEQRLAEHIARVLGRDDADLAPERPFTEYGVDSIILVELVNTLNSDMGIELNPTALFDHPTLAALAEFVHTEHDPKFPAPGSDATALPQDEAETLRRLAAGELTVEQAYTQLGGPA
jgi:acyl transferase domain-containing protein